MCQALASVTLFKPHNNSKILLLSPFYRCDNCGVIREMTGLQSHSSRVGELEFELRTPKSSHAPYCNAIS